jgi:hypothetical protein
MAYQRPNWQPYAPRRSEAAPETSRRHIEIVTTRAQRKARPKSFYAMVSVSTIFGLLIAQLLLSIVLSDGAYQISSLQAEQKQLLRTEENLAERLDLLASPQSLAIKAESLGMVIGSNAPAFLNLSTGSLTGSPVAASGSSGLVGTNGGLVANFLLASLQTPVNSPDTADSEGAPAQPSASGSVTSGSGALPSPTTR